MKTKIKELSALNLKPEESLAVSCQIRLENEVVQPNRKIRLDKLTKIEITEIANQHNFVVQFVKHYDSKWGFSTQFYQNGCRLFTNENGFYYKEQVIEQIECMFDFIDKIPITRKVLIEKTKENNYEMFRSYKEEL